MIIIQNNIAVMSGCLGMNDDKAWGAAWVSSQWNTGNATLVDVPLPTGYQNGRFSLVNGTLIPDSALQAEFDEAQQKATQLHYTTELEKMFDATAQTHQYDDRKTCALRAAYPGPFNAEGTAFGTWMDTCNAQGYTVLAQVKVGAISLPSVAEFLAAMPAMVWPD
jgi:hypothetical protein